MRAALPRLALAAAVAAAAALAIGCGPDCASLCVELNKCPGAKPADCPKQCAGAEALNRAAGCEKPFAALEACVARREDRCVKDLCAPKQRTYDACILPYCARSPAPPECR